MKSKAFGYFVFGCILFLAHVLIEYIIVNKILILTGVI